MTGWADGCGPAFENAVYEIYDVGRVDARIVVHIGAFRKLDGSSLEHVVHQSYDVG